MEKRIITIMLLFMSYFGFGQTGHVLQGIGAVNMSMGGASTGQPIDINGALIWNPAAISAFNEKILSVNAGMFFAKPKLFSSLPAGLLGPGAPAVSGTTKSDRGAIPIPAIAMVWGKEGSKHTFGLSAFGVSGLGATFLLEPNNPLAPGFNPGNSSNPITYPQPYGLGHIESNYMLLQAGFTYAYKFSDKLSIGFQPNFNYHIMKLFPNPLTIPDPLKGYPNGEDASAVGLGGQIGLFYDSKTGFKVGASYKTTQYFGDLEFKNTYLDGSAAPASKFNLDYPSIVSAGVGYSKNAIDIALDYRQIFYENADGFEKTGWTPSATIQGFGWKNVSVVCLGLQYKGINKVPLRAGYTYSTSPVDERFTFFSSPTPATIKHAFQVGAGYNISEHFTINGVFHYGTSGGSSTGNLMNPSVVSPGNPYGEIPGTRVSFKVMTSMAMIGINYNFSK